MNHVTERIYERGAPKASEVPNKCAGSDGLSGIALENIPVSSSCSREKEPR